MIRRSEHNPPRQLPHHLQLTAQPYKKYFNSRKNPRKRKIFLILQAGNNKQQEMERTYDVINPYVFVMNENGCVHID
jgi:hypothetical protein